MSADRIAPPFRAGVGSLALVTALLVSCGGESKTQQIQSGSQATSPAIQSFSATATLLTAGDAAQLTAIFSGGTATITPGNLSIQSGVPLTLSPTATTRYELLLKGNNGETVAAQLAIEVVPAPQITRFSASPEQVGPGQETLLLPQFTGGTGLIQPGAYTVTSGQAMAVRPTEATTYTLTVTNPAGKVVTSQSTIKMLAAPAITGFACQATEVERGQCAQLTARFDHGTALLQPGNLPMTSGVPITVSPVNTTCYTLIVTGPTGLTSRAEVTVPVVFKPAILRQPVSLLASVGETVRFTAEVEGSPAPTLQWERTTVPQGVWEPIPGATGPTLSMVIKADESRSSFRLTAANRLGTAVSQSATLSVTSAPSFTTQPASLSLKEGQTATFTAQASGTPRPTIQWQRSTDQGASWAPIPGATTTADGQSVLSFPAKLSDHQTRYRAVAGSKAGQATSQTAQLLVARANGAPSQPTATPDAGQLARPNRSLGWTLASTDPDSDPVSFHLTSPASTDISLVGNRLTYSPLAVQAARSVILVAKDNKDGISDPLILAVPAIVDNEPPSRPSATADPSNTPREKTTLGWTLAATDPDSEPVTFQFVSTPPSDLSISGDRLLYKPVGQQPARIVDLVAKDSKLALSPVLTLALPAIRANGVPGVPVVVPTPGNNPHAGRLLTWTLSTLDPDQDPVSFELQPGAGSDLTIAGSTLRFAPVAAQAARTVSVVAKDTWSSSAPTEVQLPAITANSIPRWYGDDLALTHTGNGTGAPLEGQPYVNQAPDRSGLPGGRNLKQTEAWPAGPSYEYSIPVGASFTWDAANLQNTYFGGVRASDPDASDALFFGLKADTASANPLPTTLTIDQQGVVRWTPSPDQVGKVFTLRMTLSDGLTERTSNAYPFYVRANESPVITSPLSSDGWVDPFATGDQTILTSRLLDVMDSDMDTVRMEPVHFTDPNVGIQHFTFTRETFNGFATGSRLQLRAFPGSSFDRLVPFVPQTLTYRARDTWDALSPVASVVVNATGRARFSRSIQYRWPGGGMELPDTLNARIFVPSPTPAGGFLANLAGSMPFQVTPDYSGLTDVRGLKAPGYFVARQSFPFTESSTWPIHATWRNDGGTGATLGSETEIVIGVPARPTWTTPMMAMFPPVHPAALRVLFSPDSASARMGNGPGSSQFLADVLSPFNTANTHLVADLNPQTVQANDGTLYANQTAYGLAAITSVQAPPSLTPLTPVTVTAGTPFSLVWQRDLFDAALRGGNDLSPVMPPRQVAYAALGFIQGDPIAPSKPNLQQEWLLLQGSQAAWDSLTVFQYTPDFLFMPDAIAARKPITLTGLTFGRAALPEHTPHYVTLFGERTRFAPGSAFVPYSVGVRSLTAFSAATPVAPVVSSVEGVRFTVANRGASMPAQVIPSPANQVLYVQTAFGSVYDSLHLQWSAPGNTSEYEVDLYDASSTSDQPATPLARWITPLTALELPVDLLPKGKNLVLRIRAKSATGRAINMGWADACRRIVL